MEGLENYKKISNITLIVLFLLIGVGGLVRVTGSGMGCPDWPKCFGLWVPPTCECQLPDNYHELYKDHGYPAGTNFDPVKTWIEYLNRMLGVLSGLFVMVNLYLAYKIRSVHKAIFTGALLCFVLVVIEGGLGALVVKLNLHQQSVTLHYFMAIVLVCCLLHSIAASVKMQHDETGWTVFPPLSARPKPMAMVGDIFIDKKKRNYLYTALLMTSIQLISGTNLRSITESLNNITISQWLLSNEMVFNMHRVYAVLLVVSIWLLWQKFKQYKFSRLPLIIIWISLAMQIITGILMNFFEFPPLAQALHILFPAILFCSQFYILSFILIKKEAGIVSV